MANNDPNSSQSTSRFTENNTSWKVIREYHNLYSPEEIVRILVRRHLEFSTETSQQKPKNYN